MPLWSKGDTNTASGGPQFLKGSRFEQEIMATDNGWVREKRYTDMHGNKRVKQEMLVPIRGLANSTNLGTATISSVKFTRKTGAKGSTITVHVGYNERVLVNSGTPTLALLAANTSNNAVPSTITTSYASGSNTNVLVFTTTSYSNAAVYTLKSATIGSGSGIVDAVAGTAADLTIPSAMTGSANSAIGVLTLT